jgi:ATP-binding cassette subfamily B protein
MARRFRRPSPRTDDPRDPLRRESRAFGRLWSRLEPFFGRNYGLLGLLVGAALISGFAEAGVLYIVVRLAVTMSAHNHDLQSVGPIGNVKMTIPAGFIAALVLLVTMLLLSFVISYATARLSVRAINRARKSVLRAFLEASWPIQSLEREGRLQELLSEHVMKVSVGVLVLSQGLIAAVNFFALAVSAFIIGPVAATTMVVGVGLVFLVLRPITRYTKAESRKHVDVTMGYVVAVNEAVAVARETRVFDVGRKLLDVITRRADEAEVTGFRMRFVATLTPRVYQFAAMTFVVVAMAVVYAVGTGEVVALGAIVILFVRALSYGQQIGMAAQQTSEVVPYLEELDRNQRLYQANAVTRGGLPLVSVQSIGFEAVGYSYLADRPVLRDVSFTVTRGEAIGIVGPSGSGKSTLVQLLLRLRDPGGGRYVVNGLPTADYDLESWCRRVVLVPQDNRLLAGTVADNIRFFRDGLSDEAVELAARRAHIHDDIMRWPNGYATVIGSGAMDISGGQRQRIGLARALVGDPVILVLDEPTSALDMQSEALVQQTLEELRGDLTLFIVAHRMSTVAMCDRIMVLENGSLEAFGTLAELNETNAFFRDAVALSRLPM